MNNGFSKGIKEIYHMGEKETKRETKRRKTLQNKEFYSKQNVWLSTEIKLDYNFFFISLKKVNGRATSTYWANLRIALEFTAPE